MLTLLALAVVAAGVAYYYRDKLGVVVEFVKNLANKAA
jgi:hypothetical protein